MNEVTKLETRSTEVITPATMIAQALASNSAPETLEKLLALQERWEAGQARKEFDNAMSELRTNLPKITKNRTVDFESKKGGASTHYKFEDLAEITEALAAPMSEVGLSFRWRTENVQGGIRVSCLIAHRDGHYEETSLVGPLDTSGNKNPIQAIGSVVSYLQRYTLKAAVGLAAARDDDGQAATPEPKPTTVSKDTTARAIFTQAEHDIRNAKTKAEMETVWGAIKWDLLPDDWKTKLAAEQAKCIEALRDAAIAKAGGQSAPSAADSLDSQFPGDM